VNLLVATETRFISARDGQIYTAIDGAEYGFWKRYLEVFDTLAVVARVRPGNDQSESHLASGPNVTFVPLPDYVGPWQYLQRHLTVRARVKTAVGRNATILRAPGMVANLVWRQLIKQGQPYAIEVRGDPFDVFAPEGVRHVFRPFFRWWFSRQLRQQCRGARAAAYVTEQHLQMRYPPSPEAWVAHYSSVELPNNAFVAHSRPVCRPEVTTLISVASLAQLYKGTDTLIEALHQCVSTGLNLRLIVVGDGKWRGELMTRAATLGLTDRISFLGQLPAGEAVRRQLDASDLFVLPSRAEGLPRAVIEAMARGLPCIGSTVGGIPELLRPEDMVEPNDPLALAEKIGNVVSDPDRMAEMSRRNLAKAKEYSNELLRVRRLAFYRYVRETTEAWLNCGRDLDLPPSRIC
jgi:glycosyltransferase involved in cell wall biosynthesis